MLLRCVGLLEGASMCGQAHIGGREGKLAVARMDAQQREGSTDLAESRLPAWARLLKPTSSERVVDSGQCCFASGGSADEEDKRKGHRRSNSRTIPGRHC